MSQSVTIAVASKNPVKVGAVEAAYRQHFPDHVCEMVACSVASGVPDQPMSDAETLRGALNRLEALRLSQPAANLWAAIEGGVDETDQGMVGFAWIVVENETQRGSARTATFPLPEKVAKLVRAGTELGLVNDEVFGRVNSKQKEGAVGILTSGLVDRLGLYEHAALFALVPIQQAALFAS